MRTSPRSDAKIGSDLRISGADNTGDVLITENGSTKKMPKKNVDEFLSRRLQALYLMCQISLTCLTSLRQQLETNRHSISQTTSLRSLTKAVKNVEKKNFLLAKRLRKSSESYSVFLPYVEQEFIELRYLGEEVRKLIDTVNEVKEVKETNG